MTRTEILSYNDGVQTALDHARRIAEVLQTRTKRPLAVGFAIGALTAFADEGRGMLLPVPADVRETPRG